MQDASDGADIVSQSVSQSVSQPASQSVSQSVTNARLQRAVLAWFFFLIHRRRQNTEIFFS